MNLLWFYPGGENNMDIWQKIHIGEELIKLGHKIVYFDPLIWKSWDEARDQLLKTAKVKRFDLFINSMGSDSISSDVIFELKKLSIFTLLICHDNTNAPYMHKSIAHAFDLVWLTSFDNLELFKRWNSNIIVMPYACNPDCFKPLWGNNINRVSFIGTPYGYRKSVINTLTKNNINVDLYANLFSSSVNDEKLDYKNTFENILNNLKFSIGRRILLSKFLTMMMYENELIPNNFLHQYPSLNFEDISKIYSNSTLSLNVIELRNTGVLTTPILKLHLRTFEIPMSGGLMFIRRSDELQKYYIEDKEVICFNCNDEMVSKADYYLNRASQKEILSLKLAARKRSLSDHTWQNRFNLIFKHID